MSAIRFQKVSLRVPREDGDDAPTTREWILDGIDLEIPLGTIFTVLGPSGSGKTSLLRLVNRLSDPTSGEIEFDGQPLSSFEPVALRRRIGYIFQVPTMLPGSVEDNLVYASNPASRSRDGQPERSDLIERLRSVSLSEAFLNREADQLSVGEQQRVSIARSLMTSPEVLLMDEPTAALDPTATARMLELIVDLHEQAGVTIVFVTHQLEQAREIGQQTAILIDGQIVETGPTAEVFTSPQTQLTRDFLAGRMDKSDSDEPSAEEDDDRSSEQDPAQ